jgi:hypothetical protein
MAPAEKGDSDMKPRILSLGLPLLFLGAGDAAASDWKWQFTPYAWAANLDVDVEVDDRTVVDEHVPVNDIVDDLDWTVQFRVEGQRGEHGLMLDVFDIRLSDDEDRVAIPTVPGAEIVLDSDIDMTIFEVGGIWNPRGDGEGFGLLYGARIIDQSEEVGVRFEGVPEAPAAQCLSDEETYLDALVGVRYVKRLSRRVATGFRADVSAGGTQLTWSTTGSLSVALGRTDRYSVVTGYRRMSIAFEEANSAQTDMTLSGFFAGLRVTF